MDLFTFRRHFPVIAKHVYLNTAAVGPLSDLARDAAISATAEQADHDSRIFDPYEAAVERTRTKLARLIGADPGEIAFMRNTVEALSVVASGLAWRADDNVVSSGLEFSGGAYYPWLNLALWCLLPIRAVPRQGSRYRYHDSRHRRAHASHRG